MPAAAGSLPAEFQIRRSHLIKYLCGTCPFTCRQRLESRAPVCRALGRGTRIPCRAHRPAEKSPRARLVHQGEPCAGLFIVGKGKVRVFKASPGGREQVLAIQGREVRSRNSPYSMGAVTRLRRLRWKHPSYCSYPGRISAPRVSNTPKSRSRCCRWWAGVYEGWSASSRSFPSRPCATA